MTEPLGSAAPLVPVPQAALPALGAPATLLSAPPALPAAATIAATVIERSPEGAVLLRSTYGVLALRTAQPLQGGARVALRLQPGNPPSVAILSVAEPEPPDEEPSTQLDLGPTVGATVIAAAPDGGPDALPDGTRLLLRVIALPLAASASALAGQVATGAAGETLIETPAGTLALDVRLALPPGATIAFERLAAAAPDPQGGTPPSLAAGWPALDQALAVLDEQAPDLAQLLRGALAPASAPALAGTLLFLMGALYDGSWPGDRIAAALAAAGQDRLRARLGSDLAALRTLGDDQATGDWQALVLPLLLAGETVTPLRLYLRRRPDGAGQPSDGTRFVIETELSRLGMVQLDGLVRGRRLDLVLRSRAPLAPSLRDEAGAIFRQASAAAGCHGDLVFATAPQFAVAPLEGLRGHVEVRI